MQTLISFVAPLIFWLLEQWFKSEKKKKDFQESYYAFLDAVDKSGAVKTANHLSANRALKEEQDRLIEELKNEGKQ